MRDLHVERRHRRNNHEGNPVQLGERGGLICADLQGHRNENTDSNEHMAGQVRVRSGETHLVGGITVLDDPIGTDDDGVNVLMLEERADHGVA